MLIVAFTNYYSLLKTCHRFTKENCLYQLIPYHWIQAVEIWRAFTNSRSSFCKMRCAEKKIHIKIQLKIYKFYPLINFWTRIFYVQCLLYPGCLLLFPTPGLVLPCGSLLVIRSFAPHQLLGSNFVSSPLLSHTSFYC